MQVKNAMTEDVRIANPHQTIRDAARMMEEVNSGVLPVGEHDRLVGMITDRDIALRGAGQNLPPSTPISEVMTDDVKYCFETDDIRNVAANMANIKLRRLPVLNRDKRLVGMVTLGDIARADSGRDAGAALSVIASPGAPRGPAAAR